MTAPLPPESPAFDEALLRSEREGYMRLALEAAAAAAVKGEVPVGAVVVLEGRVVAVAANAREIDHDPTAHAEILALRAAAQSLGHWRLCHADVYVTLEPCPMCAGAMVNARIARVVYGCDDPKAGAARTLFNLLDDPRLNHRVDVVPGVLSDECAQVLKAFFVDLRQRRSARSGVAPADGEPALSAGVGDP